MGLTYMLPQNSHCFDKLNNYLSSVVESLETITSTVFVLGLYLYLAFNSFLFGCFLG